MFSSGFSLSIVSDAAVISGLTAVFNDFLTRVKITRS